MRDDDRLNEVRRLLYGYVQSPSLRHLRESASINKLALEIMKAIDERGRLWMKWDAARERIAATAAFVWVPFDDLLAYLNDLPGPRLTRTDVEQRIRAVQDDQVAWIDEELRPGCFALYEREKAQGTEFPAILGALEEFVEAEEQRLRRERDAENRRRVEAERAALEQRFLAGADCKWTPISRSKAVYCRMNGRAFRLSPTSDKKWDLHRIDGMEDKGRWVGKYLRRGDASKVVARVAYQDEPRW